MVLIDKTPSVLVRRPPRSISQPGGAVGGGFAATEKFREFFTSLYWFLKWRVAVQCEWILHFLVNLELLLVKREMQYP